MNKQQHALSGLKVVEFTMFAAGPVVGKHLGEHGAEVVHVESRARPDGFRVHYPPYKDHQPGLNRSGTFAIFNNDTYSITLNLKTTRGLDLAKQLVAWADVVIENFAVGVMDRLGLSYQALRETNPGLIMLSSCNQGQIGPRARQRGFGSQLTSLSGFTHLAGSPDGSPMLLYGPYIDFIAVGFGLVAVMAALEYRRRTGQGQYIDLSQYESGVQFMAPAILDFELNEQLMKRTGNRSPYAAPHGTYRCRGGDAWCAIAVQSEEEWQAFCQATGHPEWATGPRFATLSARKEHEDELDRLVETWTTGLAPKEVMERLQSVGVAASAVYTMRDLFSCLQLAHRRVWRELEHPELGPFHFEAPPFILSETPADLRHPAPCLGEHNAYVYGEILSLSEEEIAHLEAEGVIV
ncbi:MAG: CoA transferase [Anaerolineae bacterium]|nr:CoA transferase [Anaerolineae bacterium]